MRSLHRWVMLPAVLLLIYLALTGLIIQMDGIAVILHPSPHNEDEIVSIREGANGIGNFTNMPAPSAFARALPDVDLRASLRRVIAAAHAAAPDEPLTSVELRAIGAQMQGIVLVGIASPHQLLFDARSGQLLSTALTPEYLYSRALPPPPRSIYAAVKAWHQFSALGAMGLWIDALMALSLIVLSISGLWVYWTLLRRRRSLGRPAWFWK